MIDPTSTTIEPFPQPTRNPGGEPCGECHLQPGETCDICGAVDRRPPNRATAMSDTSTTREVLLEQASHLDGLYAGQCEPSEYKHLIEAGVLRRSYAGPGGFLGLAKLEVVRDAG